MYRAKYYIIILVVLTTATSCSKSILKFPNKKEISEIGIDKNLFRDSTIYLNYPSESIDNTLKIKYLGAGGYFFSNGETSLLFDPFFSPYQILHLTLSKISTIPENVTKGLDDLKDEIITTTEAIFVTHSHYDHLLDVPYVYNHFLDTTKARVYGSKSTKTILSTVVDSSSVVDIETMVGSEDYPGSWIYLEDGSIRVLALKTSHAPHFSKIFDINLYKGEAKPIKKYNNDKAKTWVTKWRSEKTYGYLVDFLKEGSITFRIYLLSSASSPPDGFIHESILLEHKINLAILGAASFENVQDYPEGIIQHINPDKILITHWEDLFEPYLEEPPRLIRITNFKKLIPRINSVYPWKVNNQQQFYMPYPGNFVSIKY